MEFQKVVGTFSATVHIGIFEIEILERNSNLSATTVCLENPALMGVPVE